jgi:hypothetical protein
VLVISTANGSAATKIRARNEGGIQYSVIKEIWITALMRNIRGSGCIRRSGLARRPESCLKIVCAMLTGAASDFLDRDSPLKAGHLALH